MWNSLVGGLTRIRCPPRRCPLFPLTFKWAISQSSAFPGAFDLHMTISRLSFYQHGALDHAENVALLKFEAVDWQILYWTISGVLVDWLMFNPASLVAVLQDGPCHGLRAGGSCVAWLTHCYASVGTWNVDTTDSSFSFEVFEVTWNHDPLIDTLIDPYSLELNLKRLGAGSVQSDLTRYTAPPNVWRTAVNHWLIHPQLD